MLLHAVIIEQPEMLINNRMIDAVMKVLIILPRP
jgi:hypothetical protein